MVLAVLLIQAVALYTFFKARGVPVKKGMRWALEFVVWSMFTLTPLAQVSRAVSPSLPSYAQMLFRWVQLLQFEVASLHPACVGGYPFFGVMVSTALTSTAFITLLLLDRHHNKLRLPTLGSQSGDRSNLPVRDAQLADLRFLTHCYRY